MDSSAEFTPNEDSFTPNEDDFAPSEDDFAPSKDDFAPSEDDFGPNEYDLAPNKAVLAPNEYDLAPNKAVLAPIGDDFAPGEGSVVPHIVIFRFIPGAFPLFLKSATALLSDPVVYEPEGRLKFGAARRAAPTVWFSIWAFCPPCHCGFVRG